MKLYFLFWTLFLLLLVSRIKAQSLKTYKAETSDDEYDIIGLHYKKSANQANVKLTSLTICLRFNYLRIGRTAHILNLMSTDKNEPKLLNLEPRFPVSYINFGQSKKAKGTTIHYNYVNLPTVRDMQYGKLTDGTIYV